MEQIKKHTVVLGASENPMRYSNIAIRRLVESGHPVTAISAREGKVENIEFKTGKPEIENIDTITLYVGPKSQPEYYEYILKLNPKRVVFNPGTENYELEKMLKTKGIETVEGCTLVMLSIGNY